MTSEEPALLEEEDYYKDEDGNIVFTEKFHLKRGFCCNNGCKHCPYKNESSLTSTLGVQDEQ